MLSILTVTLLSFMLAQQNRIVRSGFKVVASTSSFRNSFTLRTGLGIFLLDFRCVWVQIGKIIYGYLRAYNENCHTLAFTPGKTRYSPLRKRMITWLESIAQAILVSFGGDVGYNHLIQCLPNNPTIAWAVTLDQGHHSFSKWAIVQPLPAPLHEIATCNYYVGKCIVERFCNAVLKLH